jgi:hypothetical protein
MKDRAKALAIRSVELNNELTSNRAHHPQSASRSCG